MIKIYKMNLHVSLSSELIALDDFLQDDFLRLNLLARTLFRLFRTSQDELLSKLSLNFRAGNITDVNSVGPVFNFETDLLIARPRRLDFRVDLLLCGRRLRFIIFADL